MTPEHQKKFEKWLEPFVAGCYPLGFDESEHVIITDKGSFIMNSEEHALWVEEKREEFLKEEPPKAGLIYVPWIIETKEEKINIERDEAVKIWEDKHSRCPQCGHNKLIYTLIGIPWTKDTDYIDDKNKAACTNCTWVGKVNKLNPKI